MSKPDLLVSEVEHSVELAHEHVAQDPKGPRGFCDVHSHDSQDADFVVARAEDVVVAFQRVALVVPSSFVAV